jgi:hypothetical protein
MEPRSPQPEPMSPEPMSPEQVLSEMVLSEQVWQEQAWQELVPQVPVSPRELDSIGEPELPAGLLLEQGSPQEM